MVRDRKSFRSTDMLVPPKVRGLGGLLSGLVCKFYN